MSNRLHRASEVPVVQGGFSACTRWSSEVSSPWSGSAIATALVGGGAWPALQEPPLDRWTRFERPAGGPKLKYTRVVVPNCDTKFAADSSSIPAQFVM